jgi:hypothetical protein
MKINDIINEDFSPISGQHQPETDVDWNSDLKFYIDNNHDILSNHFFPAVRKHKGYIGNPNIYKIYLRSIMKVLAQYINEFELSNHEELFPKENLKELAKEIAAEYEERIVSGEFDQCFY